MFFQVLRRAAGMASTVKSVLNKGSSSREITKEKALPPKTCRQEAQSPSQDNQGKFYIR